MEPKARTMVGEYFHNPKNHEDMLFDMHLTRLSLISAREAEPFYLHFQDLFEILSIEVAPKATMQLFISLLGPP